MGQPCPYSPLVTGASASPRRAFDSPLQKSRANHEHFCKLSSVGDMGDRKVHALHLSTRIFRKRWHSAEDSLVTSGWLPPGSYRFDGGGNVFMGAGSSSSDGSEEASGRMGYVYTFRILDREPKEETEVP